MASRIAPDTGTARSLASPEATAVPYPVPSPEFIRVNDILWKVLSSTNELIRYADAKAGAVLTADVVLIGAVLSLLKNQMQDVLRLHLSALVLVFLILGCLALAASAVACLVCIIPRFGGQVPPSPLFFQDIDNELREIEGTDPFKQRCLELVDPSEEFAQLVRDVRAVSRIACTKYNSVWWSIALLAAGLLAGLIAWALAMW